MRGSESKVPNLDLAHKETKAHAVPEALNHRVRTPTIPRLVRGLTKTPVDNYTALSGLVAKALIDDFQGFSNNVAIKVKDISGYGGAKTFLVSDGNGAKVVLHSCPNNSDETFMKRMGAASLVFDKHSVGPVRLAQGSDWFIERHEGIGNAKIDTLEDAAAMGRLIARVHQIPTQWFEPFRCELIKFHPWLNEIPLGSHTWLLVAKGCLDEVKSKAMKDPAVLTRYSKIDTLTPLTSAGSRIVTAHGDFHPGNTLQLHRSEWLDGNECPPIDRICIDFELSCVAHAAIDLGFMLSFFSEEDEGGKRAFLHAYLTAMGEPVDELNALMVDCHIVQLTSWCKGGILVQCLDMDDRDKIEELIEECRAIAGDIRASPELQEKLRKMSLRSIIPHTATYKKKLADKIYKSQWYLAMQSKLNGALPSQCAVAAPFTIDEHHHVVMIKASPSLAMQVKPGTCLLELATARESDLNQQWVRQLNDDDGSFRLLHVSTGLFLDAEVKYAYMVLGEPWHRAGSELTVKARDDSGRQLWIDETGNNGLIRHFMDGRSLHVNFQELKIGNGVNINVPCSSTHVPCSSHCWSMETVQLGLQPTVDASINQYSPCTPIANFNEDEEFFIIQSASDLQFCLSVNDDDCICLTKLSGCAKQKWRLVEGDKFQNVGNGLFLDSEIKYITVHDINEVWINTDTDLKTMPRDDVDKGRQRWVLGPEEFHGGKVLRHYRDGRVVSVENWSFSDGAKVDVGNVALDDCRGGTYVLLTQEQIEEHSATKG